MSYFYDESTSELNSKRVVISIILSVFGIILFFSLLTSIRTVDAGGIGSQMLFSLNK